MTKNIFFNFCVGVDVDGHDTTNFLQTSKDAHKNSASFDINFMVVGDGANMVSHEKPTKK